MFHYYIGLIRAKLNLGAMMSIGWAIISAGDYADSRGAPGINQADGAELGPYTAGTRAGAKPSQRNTGP